MSRAFGGRELRELSDAELRREAEARRRARRGGRRAAPVGDAPAPEQVRKYLANLELEPGASKSEIEERYLELLDRYDPERQKDDAKKAVARELTEKLRVAYRGLKAYLASR